LTIWSALLANPAVLLLCGQQFFRASGSVFWYTWCPTYLQNVHGLNPKSAGTWTSLPIFGVFVGSIAGGLVADRIWSVTGSRRASRVGTAVGSTFLGVLFFGLAYFIPNPLTVVAVIVLFLAATSASGGNSCSYSIAMDM